MASLVRITDKMILSITSGAAVSNEVVDFKIYSGGILLTPSAWTAADIGFKVAGESGDTFLPLKDHDDAYVVIDGVDTAQANAYELPPELFGARYFKLWSTDGAGADTNQGANRTLVILLKS